MNTYLLFAFSGFVFNDRMDRWVISSLKSIDFLSMKCLFLRWLTSFILWTTVEPGYCKLPLHLTHYRGNCAHFAVTQFSDLPRVAPTNTWSVWKTPIRVSCFSLSVPHIPCTVKGENVPKCYQWCWHPTLQSCPPHQWPALNSEAPCPCPQFPFLSSLVPVSNCFPPSLCFLIVGVMASSLNSYSQCYTLTVWRQM